MEPFMVRTQSKLWMWAIFFITLAKKLKNLSWKDGWFRRWYVFAFKHTQTKLPTFYEYSLPFLILTINTSKQFKVASILLSQFKCITILRFYLKIFIQVRFVVVFLIFVHKATSVFCPMDQKKCVNPSHDCVSSPLLQSSLVLSLFNVSVEIHSYTQLRSKLGINVYKPHHSQEWSVQ